MVGLCFKRNASFKLVLQSCLLVLFCIGFNLAANAQYNDANIALPIFSDGNLSINSTGPGINDFANPLNSSGCIDIEHQSAWLFVAIQESGTLAFIIDPAGADDYDFAVYGPNRTPNNLGGPLRCSWAAGNGNTGLRPTSNDLSEGANGDGFVRDINANAGETYYIFIDNYSSSNQGFTLTWTGTAVLDSSVVEECPVVDLGNDTTICDMATVQIGKPQQPGETYAWNTGATSSQITVGDAGWYSLTVTKNGCEEIDSILISEAVTPMVDLGNDTILCEGQVLLLDGNVPTATSYTWQDNSTSPLFLVETAGTYRLRVANGNCFSTDEITVQYRQQPNIDLGADTSFCNNGNFVLNAASAGVNDYVWQDGSTGSTFTATTDGIYFVTGSNEACSASDTVTLSFKQDPMFDLGDDQSYCEGITITLDASAVDATDYLWQDGSTSPTLKVDSSGMYSVKVSIDECFKEDTIEITFLEYPEVDLPEDTLLCVGDTLLLDAFSPISGVEYEWQDGSTTANYTVSGTGVYGVTVTNDFCSNSDFLRVTYKPAPIFDLGLDTVLCEGNIYPIELPNQPDDVVINWIDNSSDSIYLASESGVYVASATNFCGTTTDSVVVEYGSCDCEFYFPTGFTPNNDGLNDNFQPIINCDSVTYFSMEIYNRWGELLFQTDNPEESWKAANSNDDLTMDAYIWAIEYRWRWRGREMSNAENGHFSIIR